MGEQWYSDGEPIFGFGDPADGVYRVRAGRVRLLGPRESASVAGDGVLLGPGELFGDTGFLVGDGRPVRAVAVGDVAVDFLRRNEVLFLMSEMPDRLAPLLAALFGPLGPAEEAVSERATETPSGATEIRTASGLVRIRLVPDGKRVRTLVRHDEVAVDAVPFIVGRTASGEGKGTYADVSLPLADQRPFSLSRRHFSIDCANGALLVRDMGSYHGTTVNGLILGGNGRPTTAPLRTGENELTAGKADSPFRFRIVVEAAPAAAGAADSPGS